MAAISEDLPNKSRAKSSRPGAKASTSGAKSTAKSTMRKHIAKTGRKSVDCNFLCGCNSEHEDPVEVLADNSRPLIKWGRGSQDRKEDGTVCGSEADWYCNRVFAARFSHQHSREDFLKLIVEDKSVHDDFMKERRDLIARRKNGQRAEPRTGVSRSVEDVGTQLPVGRTCSCFVSC